VASDSIRIRLHLRAITAIGVVVDSLRELVVEVETDGSWSRCPACGFKCRRVHDRRIRKIGDLSVSGRKVTLMWQRRRFACGNCDERHVETHPEFEGNLTRRLARQVVADAKVMSIRAVAKRHGVSWWLVMNLVSDWADTVAAHRRKARCRVLLVDETSIRKRHRYVTVLMNGETGEVLAMVPHRNAAALTGFLAEQGHRWCRNVEIVVTDGSKSYKTAIDSHLGHATHILDRFHVVRWFSQGLTLVRREVQRRQPVGEAKPAFEPDVLRARFALLRRGDTLDETARERLNKLFAGHPRLGSAWAALQELYGLYQAENLAEAEAALGRFADLYATGELPEFHAVVNTIIAWGPEILAYHQPGAHRISNGRLEGTNNKLQVLRRVAYGFTNTTNFASRGILACGPIRSPQPKPATPTP